MRNISPHVAAPPQQRCATGWHGYRLVTASQIGGYGHAYSMPLGIHWVSRALVSVTRWTRRNEVLPVAEGVCGSNWGRCGAASASGLALSEPMQHCRARPCLPTLCHIVAMWKCIPRFAIRIWKLHFQALAHAITEALLRTRVVYLCSVCAFMDTFTATLPALRGNLSCLGSKQVCKLSSVARFRLASSRSKLPQGCASRLCHACTA